MRVCTALQRRDACRTDPCPLLSFQKGIHPPLHHALEHRPDLRGTLRLSLVSQRPPPLLLEPRLFLRLARLELPACLQTARLFLDVVLCLSRACLGRTIVFM